VGINEKTFRRSGGKEKKKSISSLDIQQGKKVKKGVDWQTEKKERKATKRKWMS